jgi:hypothetical protein
VTARLIAVALGLALLAGRAGAERWQDVFAAEHDTTVFLAGDGALFRASFDLAWRDTLWRPRGDQRVVRFAVSPDGTHVAWVTRGADLDTTCLWISGPDRTRRALRYFSFQPRYSGYLYSEPGIPTVADRTPRGVRLVRGSSFSRRSAATTLEWTADGSRVLVGHDFGIADIPVDSLAMTSVPGLSAVSLEALRPSPMFLADVVVNQADSSGAITRTPEPDVPPAGGPGTEASPFDAPPLMRLGTRVSAGAPRRTTVLIPGAVGWGSCDARGWTGAHIRTPGRRALWWADGSTVRSVSGVDCSPFEEVLASDPIGWLGFDGSRDRLVVVAGRQLWTRPEPGGASSVILETASDIRRVLGPTPTGAIGLVTEDSLYLWSPATDAVRRLACGRLEPCELFDGPDGTTVVQVGIAAAGSRHLARADAGAGALVSVETPGKGEGIFRAVAHGAWILLYRPGSAPAREILAYDVRRDRWRLVSNPGLIAWEPLSP